MEFNELIYKRKSCRDYLDETLDENTLNNIEEFIRNAKPLNENINFEYKILTPDDLKIRTPWKAPYYLALFSDKKENYLENIGFIFEQVGLYIQSINLGCCWVGMADLKVKDPNFIITIAFGKSDDTTRNLNDFKRKNHDEISDDADDRLKPAQYAPSAINSQPWYFKHSDDGFDVYQIKHNIIKRKILENLNRIDIGICLAHMYIANEETFEFKIKNDYDEVKGYTYSGSIKI